MAAKTITKAQILGKRGETFVGLRVLEMGYVWHPTGSVEAGVDGHIELRDESTGEAYNSWIGVQSKATGNQFPKESDQGFEWTVSKKDLNYWLKGNLPIILVVCRPETNEAYWVSIKDYFANIGETITNIIFSKEKDRFDNTAADKIKKLALNEKDGIYHAPMQKKEKLYSNLLKVKSIFNRIYIAETRFTERPSLFSELRNYIGNPGNGWWLKDNQIISTFDLAEYPWNKFCDIGTLEDFGADEWAFSEDEEKQKQFVLLLKLSLTEKINEEVKYDKYFDYYYFRPLPGGRERCFDYVSITNKTRAVVVKNINRYNGGGIYYCRHDAFKGRFKRIEDEWVLEILPTYHFTSNGYDLFCRYEDYLSGLKRLQRNQAVLGKVIMWARFLAGGDSLFSARSMELTFGDLLSFEAEFGISDKDWLPNDEQLLKEYNGPQMRFSI